MKSQVFGELSLVGKGSARATEKRLLTACCVGAAGTGKRQEAALDVTNFMVG